MTRFRPLSIVILCALALALPGCSNAKKELGLTRKAPDEFTVVKRAPLAMPPDFMLRPPVPGAPRPQEAALDAEARAVVFGQPEATSGAAPTTAETALLQQTGATQADPAIRAVVDHETAILEPREKPVAEKLLGWSTGGDDAPPANIVDAPAEAERLKQNQAEGKPVTEGETPSKEVD